MTQHIRNRTPRLNTPLAIGMVCAAACLLSACGGGSDSDGDHGAGTAASPKVTEAVPANASTDATAATAYTGQLSATPAVESDALEPVAVPEQLAGDDTAEPA